MVSVAATLAHTVHASSGSSAETIVEQALAVQVTFRVLAQTTAAAPFVVAWAFTWPRFARSRRHATGALTMVALLHIVATTACCV